MRKACRDQHRTMISSREEGLDIISLWVVCLRLIVPVDVIKDDEPPKNSIRLLLDLLTTSDGRNGRLRFPVDIRIPWKSCKTQQQRIFTVAVQPQDRTISLLMFPSEGNSQLRFPNTAKAVEDVDPSPVLRGR
ncbi:MAG: hypothetical protein Q9184_006040 [Pyrenodesmia sp. 2 TL-2023]